MTLSSVFWVLFIFICNSIFATSDPMKLIVDYTNLITRNEKPDYFLNTPQMIAKYGYPPESHTIKTEDGYILQLHRIPHGIKSNVTTKRLPVLLEHGLFGSSDHFILNGPERSLAYLLADEGYDVWLGNLRGNTYSKAHVMYKPLESQFWNFSWHEMGIYDIPAQIDYICNYTNRDKLIYLGYSLGTTSFFVMSTEKPDYQSKVKGAIMLAPLVYMNYVKSIPVRLFGRGMNVNGGRRHDILYKFGAEFLKENPIIKEVLSSSCSQYSTELEVCRDAIFLITGPDKEQFNTSALPYYFNHVSDGTSVRSLIHYAQLIKTGKFRQFDYESNYTNKNVYGEGIFSPPSYDLTKVNVSLYLYQGKNDYLVNMEDYQRLMNEFPAKAKVKGKVIDYPNFNHIDFILAKDVKSLLYDDVVAKINAIESN